MDPKLLKGKYWAMLEHIFFWISILIFTVAVVTGGSDKTMPEQRQASQPASSLGTAPSSVIPTDSGASTETLSPMHGPPKYSNSLAC